MSAPDATGDALLPEEVRTGHSEPVDRILATAYELFSHRGVRDVGINELIERSGVAKSTFYRHFPSKDALVLAFLALRDRVWTVDLIVSEARRRGASALRSWGHGAVPARCVSASAAWSRTS